MIFALSYLKVTFYILSYSQLIKNIHWTYFGTVHALFGHSIFNSLWSF